MFFKYENNKVIVVMPQSKIMQNIPFVDQREVFDRPYDLLKDQEKKIFNQSIGKYSSFVDKSARQLRNLISGESGDNLDIPE
ncbi:MAG: hypothetical protein GXP45_05680 [bacterium]|nr:hypothetical protein [bacterium]